MNALFKQISIGLVFLACATFSHADEPPVCVSPVMSAPVTHNRLISGSSYKKTVVKRSSGAMGAGYQKNLVRKKPILAHSVFPGHILQSEGDVFLVERGGVVLNKPVQLTTGFAVRLQDVIQTYGQSFVSIELGDGVRMVLPSNSRIQLAQVNNRLARIKLLSGRIENHVPKRPNAKSNVFEIQTPAVVLGVRGTYFRAQYNETDHVTTTNILDGTVAVSALAQCVAPLMVNAGQGVSLQYSIPEQPTTLLSAPDLVEKSKDAQINRQVQIKVNPVVGAVKYHAELSLDDAFLDKYRESYSTTSELSFEGIPSGFYFVRVTAIDTKGIEGHYTEHFFLRSHTDDLTGDVH